MNDSLGFLLKFERVRVKELFDSKSHMTKVNSDFQKRYEPDIKLADPVVSNQDQTLVQKLVCVCVRDWVISG